MPREALRSQILEHARNPSTIVLEIVGQASLPVEAARSQLRATLEPTLVARPDPRITVEGEPRPPREVARANDARASSTGRDACPTILSNPHHHQFVAAVVYHLDRDLAVLAALEGCAGFVSELIPDCLVIGAAKRLGFCGPK